MKVILNFVIVGFTLLIGCSNASDYNSYYYGKENFRFLCEWDHHIVAEDLGDSLQIWNLDDECNAGYWSTSNMRIPKRTGIFDDVEVTSISFKEIELKLNRGHEVVSFDLSRQKSVQKSNWV